MNKKLSFMELLLLMPASEDSCVDLDKLKGLTIDIPLAAPVPQKIQPASPEPPLPTDTQHTMSEWPPAKP